MVGPIVNQLQKIEEFDSSTTPGGIALVGGSIFSTVLARVGLLDIVSSAADTALISATVPANRLGTASAVRISVIGDYLNNSLIARTVRLRVIFGGTTIVDDTSLALPIAATRRPFLVNVLLGNQASASVQFCALNAVFGAFTAATVGVGDLAVAAPDLNNFLATAGTAAINTAIDQVLEVRVNNSIALATVSLRRQYGLMEIV